MKENGGSKSWSPWRYERPRKSWRLKLTQSAKMIINEYERLYVPRLRTSKNAMGLGAELHRRPASAEYEQSQCPNLHQMLTSYRHAVYRYTTYNLHNIAQPNIADGINHSACVTCEWDEIWSTIWSGVAQSQHVLHSLRVSARKIWVIGESPPSDPAFSQGVHRSSILPEPGYQSWSFQWCWGMFSIIYPKPMANEGVNME